MKVKPEGESLPVLPLRKTMFVPGQVAIEVFQRIGSRRALDAASSSGRRAVIARQREPNTEKPGRRDLFEIGMLVEITNVERDGDVATVQVRVIEPVRMIKTDFESPYLRLFVTPASAYTNDDIGGATTPTPSGRPRAWLPEALIELHGYLSHQLGIDLAHPWDPRNTELSLQHQVSAEIRRWLGHSGVDIHFKLTDNQHMPAQRFSGDLRQIQSGRDRRSTTRRAATSSAAGY
ncbi:MAG: hypothetical protein NT062_36590 [Proteobacteria bacterium]|nr:hypothetical protein [Pseudomonadota bacterium]